MIMVINSSFFENIPYCSKKRLQSICSFFVGHLLFLKKCLVFKAATSIHPFILCRAPFIPQKVSAKSRVQGLGLLLVRVVPEGLVIVPTAWVRVQL